MKCARCHRVITKPDYARAHIERDVQGRVKRIVHNKCWRAERRDQMLWKNQGEAPTAYEEKARYRNADDFPPELGTTSSS